MTRITTLRFLKILIVLIAILLALSALHLVLFFQYHQVKRGMSYAEVEKIMVGIQYDDWGVPGNTKATLSFYFARPCTIVIEYDSELRVVHKKIQYFR